MLWLVALGLTIVFCLRGTLATRVGALMTARRLTLLPLQEEKGGTFDRHTKTRKNSISALPSMLGLGLAVSIRSVAGSPTIADLFVAALCGAGIGWLATRRRLENTKAANIWRMERELPNVVERIVMGVTAGLDVLPAMKAAISSGPDDSNVSPQTVNVASLLKRAISLHERGLSFNKAIEETSKVIDVPSVRHAFVHLGIAQQQGGELIRPLRELADATQLHFQEKVDEEIAKLPVKATVPLLITFAGLIIFFITIPVIQVSSITKQVTATREEK